MNIQVNLVTKLVDIVSDLDEKCLKINQTDICGKILMRLWKFLNDKEPDNIDI